MESIDEILNNNEDAEKDGNEVDPQDDAVIDGKATGETTQVAAEKDDAAVSAAQIKAELSALVQERARIRQKEAALDEERARITAGTADAIPDKENTASDPRTELKALRKQHREALMEGVDEDEVEAIEEQMEELRLSIYRQENKATTAQEQVNNEFNTVYAKVHEEFPFLKVDHPDVNQELNEDINAHYLGRIQKGDSQAVALRKAVDKFAPAYAKSSLPDTKDNGSAEKIRKADADRLVREKLDKSGFSEVRSVSRSQSTKPFTGNTPMEDILKKAK